MDNKRKVLSEFYDYIEDRYEKSISVREMFNEGLDFMDDGHPEIGDISLPEIREFLENQGLNVTIDEHGTVE